jgi:hypothetical protein
VSIYGNIKPEVKFTEENEQKIFIFFQKGEETRDRNILNSKWLTDNFLNALMRLV